MDDFHPVPTSIGVYTGGPRPVAQTAVKDPNRSRSEITEACLTKLGLTIPPSGRRKLKWAYKACTFWTEFVVVASAKDDIVLGSADDERVRDADIPSSFPSQVEMKSRESKRQHKEGIAENKGRQQNEKSAEHKIKLAEMRPRPKGNPGVERG